MIVLLTDFGPSEYVGVMKGVIYSINPDARVVDLCHDIRPQCVAEAAWILKINYTYFPPGSTFCCVVDPSVGGRRKAVAVQTQHYVFIAPDNGLLWETLVDQQIVSMLELPVPNNASRTFHGRDVFARAAARADWSPFEHLGKPLDTLEKLQLHQEERQGIVVRIDHFGNIVTNLPPLAKGEYTVTIDGQDRPMRHCSTYEEAPDDELFLITGSSNTLEISCKNASATSHLKLRSGQKISIA